MNLGPAINTEHNEFCPTLASDGQTFYFGSDRPGGEGSSDHYVTHRGHAGSRLD